MTNNNCSTTSKARIISATENRRRFEILNPEKTPVTKILIDGCLINDHRERCDFLFEIGEQCHHAIYVELKGADVRKAYSQIEATLIALKPRHNQCRILCFIVASRVPRASPSVQQLTIKLAREHKAQLKVGTAHVRINLSDLLGCPQRGPAA